MNAFKIFCGALAVCQITALSSAVAGLLAWNYFWIITIVIAGFAYLIIPKLEK